LRLPAESAEILTGGEVPLQTRLIAWSATFCALVLMHFSGRIRIAFPSRFSPIQPHFVLKQHSQRTFHYRKPLAARFARRRSIEDHPESVRHLDE
jgi:hypothetical protein